MKKLKQIFKKNVVILFTLLLTCSFIFSSFAFAEPEKFDLKILTPKAENGDAEAQFRLFIYYYEKSDNENSFYWLQKAAENKHAKAEYFLGLSYFEQKDYENAVLWLQKAAEQNNADAQFFLAFCYSKGFGVKENLLKAINWYNKSAKQGNEEAKIKVVELESKLGVWSKSKRWGATKLKNAGNWCDKKVEAAEKWSKSDAGRATFDCIGKALAAYGQSKGYGNNQSSTTPSYQKTEYVKPHERGGKQIDGYYRKPGN